MRRYPYNDYLDRAERWERVGYRCLTMFAFIVVLAVLAFGFITF